MTDKIVKTEAEWRAQLTAEQYHVTRAGQALRGRDLPLHLLWRGAVLFGDKVQFRQWLAKFLRQAGRRGGWRDRG